MPAVAVARKIIEPPPTPNRFGSPNVLRVESCIRTPASPRQAPVTIDTAILGILMFQIIVLDMCSSSKTNNPSKISSSGQFKLHYSPGIPIRLNVKKINEKEAYLSIKKIGPSNTNFYFLSKNGNLKEAAKNLYSTLRKIKKNKYKSIAVSKIPNKGLGKTINDRLKRASIF